jgi:bifunctional non-homologous end joining protein LigD
MKTYQPMLCALKDKSYLKNKDYIWEPKLDGTRVLIYVNKSIKLINRRNKNITSRYFPELDFRKNIKAKSAVLDAEIVIYDKKGNPNFNLLQSREQTTNKVLIEIKSKEYPATFVVFDILELNNKPLINKPLEQRKNILKKIITDSKHIEKIFYTTKGQALWKIITKRKLEGVIGKQKASKYYPGKRTDKWIKIKFLTTLDAIIIGYTTKKRAISSLLLAIYHKNKLTYIGKVGTGFTESFLRELYKTLTKIKQKKPLLKLNEKVTWVKPKLVCEVKYLELSKNLIMRAPSFIRLKQDKNPQECVLN